MVTYGSLYCPNRQRQPSVPGYASEQAAPRRPVALRKVKMASVSLVSGMMWGVAGSIATHSGLSSRPDTATAAAATPASPRMAPT